MKLKLELGDRISLRALFPQQSNIVSALVRKSIEEKIQITHEEQKGLTTINAGTKDERVTWPKLIYRTFDFTDVEIEFLKDQVNRVDKENKITPDLLDVALLIKNASDEKPKKKSK